MKFFFLSQISFPVLLLACLSPSSNVQNKGHDPLAAAHPDSMAQQTAYVPVPWPFEEAKADYTQTTVTLPEGLRYDLLFAQDRDSVMRADGLHFPAKGYHDMNAYLPFDSSNVHGWVYTSHESRLADPNLGDAGGGTLYEVKKTGEKWNVVPPFYHVDFKEVGGSLRNCGGTVTPYGTILSAEETFAPSNRSIWLEGRGFLDTSDFNGRSRHLNMGFMVEIDPKQKKATRKLLAMGRFMHEDAECMPDGKTVYLTDDYNPAVWFKFVADEAFEYDKGQLYAYKQSADGHTGEWLPLPRDTASLLNIREVALRKGATMFIRHEWIVEHKGKLYISETGADVYSWSAAMHMGGVPAKHIQDRLLLYDSIYEDVHGRILEFDPQTMRMRTYLEGGPAPGDPTKVFSNPDCISKVALYGTTWLVICEDINWFTKGRVDAISEANRQVFNELYLLDLENPHPTRDQLHRLMMGPKGCETTGAIFTPDGSSLFVNIMHPWPLNPEPFNVSATIAISGFEKK